MQQPAPAAGLGGFGALQRPLQGGLPGFAQTGLPAAAGTGFAQPAAPQFDLAAFQAQQEQKRQAQALAQQQAQAQAQQAQALAQAQQAQQAQALAQQQAQQRGLVKPATAAERAACESRTFEYVVGFGVAAFLLALLLGMLLEYWLGGTDCITRSMFGSLVFYSFIAAALVALVTYIAHNVYCKSK
jgi:hypothetical protein